MFCEFSPFLCFFYNINQTCVLIHILDHITLHHTIFHTDFIIDVLLIF
jgi:hypothetical protein